MTDDAHYKAALEAEATTLKTALTELAIPHAGTPYDFDETPGSTATSEPDDNIAADRHETWHTRRAEVATLEVRLQNVMRALAALERGTYGVCSVCQQPIEPARLDANPAAHTCIAHKDGSTTSS